MCESSNDSYYSAHRMLELEKIWKMIFPVLPRGTPSDLPVIYAAMLRRYETIPFENWEKSVRDILVSESRRSDSPISHYDEDSFYVYVDIESWLSTRKDYLPNFERIIKQEINEMSNGASTEDVHSLENLEVILDGPLAGFNPMNPTVPPGMDLERAQILTNEILKLIDPAMRSTIIEKIQVYQLGALRYARELWRLALYDNALLKCVFETFCELANQSPTWAEIVLDTIFCVELQPQDEEAPFNYIVDAGIALPPDMSVLRVAGLLYLLNYMNKSPDNWNNVIKWLLEKHTNQFRSLFLGILINVGHRNEHLQGAVLRIFWKLINRESWESTYLMFKRGSHSVD